MSSNLKKIIIENITNPDDITDRYTRIGTMNDQSIVRVHFNGPVPTNSGIDLFIWENSSTKYIPIDIPKYIDMSELPSHTEFITHTVYNPSTPYIDIDISEKNDGLIYFGASLDSENLVAVNGIVKDTGGPINLVLHINPSEGFNQEPVYSIDGTVITPGFVENDGYYIEFWGTNMYQYAIEIPPAPPGPWQFFSTSSPGMTSPDYWQDISNPGYKIGPFSFPNTGAVKIYLHTKDETGIEKTIDSTIYYGNFNPTIHKAYINGVSSNIYIPRSALNNIQYSLDYTAPYATELYINGVARTFNPSGIISVNHGSVTAVVNSPMTLQSVTYITADISNPEEQYVLVSNLDKNTFGEELFIIDKTEPKTFDYSTDFNAAIIVGYNSTPEFVNGKNIVMQTDNGNKTIYTPTYYFPPNKREPLYLYVRADGATFFARDDHYPGIPNLTYNESLLYNHIARIPEESENYIVPVQFQIKNGFGNFSNIYTLNLYIISQIDAYWTYPKPKDGVFNTNSPTIRLGYELNGTPEDMHGITNVKYIINRITPNNQLFAPALWPIWENAKYIDVSNTLDPASQGSFIANLEPGLNKLSIYAENIYNVSGNVDNVYVAYDPSAPVIISSPIAARGPINIIDGYISDLDVYQVCDPPRNIIKGSMPQVVVPYTINYIVHDDWGLTYAIFTGSPTTPEGHNRTTTIEYSNDFQIIEGNSWNKLSFADKLDNPDYVYGWEIIPYHVQNATHRDSRQKWDFEFTMYGPSLNTINDKWHYTWGKNKTTLSFFDESGNRESYTQWITEWVPELMLTIQKEKFVDNVLTGIDYINISSSYILDSWFELEDIDIHENEIYRYSVISLNPSYSSLISSNKELSIIFDCNDAGKIKLDDITHNLGVYVGGF